MTRLHSNQSQQRPKIPIPPQPPPPPPPLLTSSKKTGEAGNPDTLGVELLETLVKMALMKEEKVKLRDYRGDISKLGSGKIFLKGILDIPCTFRRVEVMLYRANFKNKVKYLRSSFEKLEI
ncbi:hypothetical protein L1887_26862 [Cichorium endivia]|nr:hypothetical protein L1887_26862 [Cichorium endivia]